MTAHVAEAGESRGRVVLQSCSPAPNHVAIEAAVKIARAFQAEIEGVFVEHRMLLDLASFPFAREISMTGRASRSISRHDMASDLRLLAARFHRSIDDMARPADVPVKRRVVCDEPLQALAAACAECGPWNVVALADPFNAPSFPSVDLLFRSIEDVTGVVIVGPQANRLQGPVLIAVEDVELIPGLLRAADRIAAVDESPLRILLVCDDDARLVVFEGQTRLMLQERLDVSYVVTRALRTSSAVYEALRRERPGMILARFGGLVVPSEADLRPFATALECPILLVR